YESRVERWGDLILYRIGASHFLWKMVRRIVGALVEVGRSNLTDQQILHFLSGNERGPAAWTAPPSGLFLERVLYEGDPPPGELRPALFRS
ncbi:MAG: tRNA pseudouridine(38-40) synthase TruA, partial [Acidobacteria bacterium]|nr:tRNA pseudouridine(38-40) synthase TruA [Acidobacteriota bacterium]